MPRAPSMRFTGVPGDRSSSLGWSGAWVGYLEPHWRASAVRLDCLP
ncbi:MAG: hypothetical protein ACLPXT_08860 [Terracidiphilus sp.]